MLEDRDENFRIECRMNENLKSFENEYRAVDGVYKPGTEVKFLGRNNKRLKGKIVGAFEHGSIPETFYVVISKRGKLHEVGEIGLMHEWEIPNEQFA